MTALAQVLAVTRIHLRSLPQRLGASASAAVGVAGVVATMVAVLAIAEGFAAALSGSGTHDTAIVLRSGSDTEMSSLLTLDDARTIADGPGVRRGPRGPLASAEMFVVVDVPKRSTGTLANVPLRGVDPAALEIRPSLRIVEGRPFEPGRNEVLVGIGAAQQFAGLDVGRTLRWGNTEWTVVGQFASDGTLWESELWCDARVLQPLYRRGSTVQSVYVRLEGPDSFAAFKDALTADPRLDVKVQLEETYFAEQAEALNTVITSLGYFIAVLMGVGAVFGAVNTMYSAVASRTREIATLRALGFGAGPTVVSILVESTLIALLGGIVGGLAAQLAFDGYRTSTLNWSSFSQVTFAFDVTPKLLALGVTWAIGMGLLGGLLPAWRAARLPVAQALREL
jgi:putative ABC transport system permease protein